MLAPYLATAQEAPKVVWVRSFGYTPPPVGHFNVYMGPIGIGDWLLELCTHYFAANGTYVPCVAESWKLDPNYMWFTVTLKKGVKFHDGHTLTTKDLLASFAGPYLLKDRLGYYIKNIKVVDDYTVNFTFTEKTDYPMFYILWHWNVVSYTQYGNYSDKVLELINQGYSIWRDADLPKFQPLLDGLKLYRPTSIIGCGPYKLKSISDTMIVLEKFTDYFGGVPPVDEIQLVRYATSDLIYAAAIKGDIDYLWAIAPPIDIANQIKAAPFAWTTVIPRSVGVTLFINKRIYPFTLLNMRRALAYAINRTEMAYVQYPGGYVASKYLIGWHTPDVTRYLNQSFVDKYIKDFTYDYNPTKANQLLDDLGFKRGPDGYRATPNGTKLEFELLSGGWVVATAGENMAAQLAKVGIRLTVKMIDGAVFGAVDGPFYRGNYQIAANVYGGPGFAYDEYYNKYFGLFPGHSDKYGTVFGQMQKVPWKTDPVNITRLTTDINLYPAQISQARLTEIYSELSYITGDQVPVINLYQPAVLLYLNKDKFAFPTEYGYWAGLGSYELHGLRPLFTYGWLKPKYTLSVVADPANGGTVSSAGGTFAKGDKVTITATPASGYSFDKWVVDGQPGVTTTTITITMDAAHSVRALFARVPYELYVGGAVVVVIVLAAVYWFFLRKKPEE